MRPTTLRTLEGRTIDAIAAGGALVDYAAGARNAGTLPPPLRERAARVAAAYDRANFEARLLNRELGPHLEATDRRCRAAKGA